MAHKIILKQHSAFQTYLHGRDSVELRLHEGAGYDKRLMQKNVKGSFLAQGDIFIIFFLYHINEQIPGVVLFADIVSVVWQKKS